MNHKQFSVVKEFAHKRYLDATAGLSLKGGEKALSHEELVILCYYMGTIDYLASLGLIDNDKVLFPEWLEHDSNPAEVDYL